MKNQLKIYILMQDQLYRKPSDELDDEDEKKAAQLRHVVMV